MNAAWFSNRYIAHHQNSSVLPPDGLCVYRQSEGIFTYYDLMAALVANATLLAAAVARDPANGKTVFIHVTTWLI